MAITGPDSADPKQLLSDLRQIAAVCQRLGIDLSKVAAMGQTIGGKATGQGGVGFSNQDHASSHPGGGTGYQNMAAGQIIGSVMSDKMRNMGYGSNSSGRSNSIKWLTKEGRLVDSPFGKEANSLKGNLAWRAVSEDILSRSGPDKVLSAGIGSRSIDIRKQCSQDRMSRTGSYDPSSRGRAMPHNLFGDRYQKRMVRTFTTLHGVMTIKGALTDPIDEEKGETRMGKIGNWGVDVARMGIGAMEANAFLRVGTAMRRGWQTGSGLAGKGIGALGGARLAAGRVAVPLMLAEAGVLVVSSAIDMDQIDRSASYQLAAAKNGWAPELRPSKTGEKLKISPLSAEQTVEFMKSVERGRHAFWIDPVTGERKQRSSLMEAAHKLPFARIWNVGKEQKDEIEWRMKEASRLHESAKKKGELMDWTGAIQETREAKRLIVAKEAMPYFWKQPEEFLRSMEASRIAGRNWARSQQPRGGDRTGD